MKATLKSDHKGLPLGSRAGVRVLLKLDAPRGAEDTRSPVNLGVVLDRSGSMTGAKIHNVREATKRLVEELGPDDTFSLTIFDDRIKVPVAPRRMGGSLRSIRSIVDGVQPRNLTNLCGGFQAGCLNVSSSRRSGDLARIILLTDGLANVGVTDPAEIGRVTREMAERGIVTSTVGVGSDYSELLLGKMAEAGGGNTYFLKSASEVEEVLAEEIGCLFSVAVQDLTVRFEPRVDGIRVLQLNSYRTAGDHSWKLGDVYAGQSKTLVLELDVPPMAEVGACHVGTVHLTGEDAAKGEMKAFSTSLELRLEVVPEEAYGKQEPDAEVTVHVANLIAARVKMEARECANRGDFASAARALRDCADRLESFGVTHAELKELVDELREEAVRLERGREDYYTAMRRKQMYYESELVGKGKVGHYASMRSRHARYEDAEYSSECHVHPLCVIGGRMFAQIGTELYLLDTGAVRSRGHRPSVVIGAETFPLSQETGDDPSGPELEPGMAGVLGADVLERFDVLLDSNKGYLTLNEKVASLPGREVKAGFTRGVPILQVGLEKRRVRLALCTGTSVSLLRDGLLEGTRGKGRVKLEIDIGGETVRIAPRPVPDRLERYLSDLDVEGVLGVDILKSERLGISSRQGRVTL